jgi:hypothetical protein
VTISIFSPVCCKENVCGIMVLKIYIKQNKLIQSLVYSVGGPGSQTLAPINVNYKGPNKLFILWSVIIAAFASKEFNSSSPLYSYRLGGP